MNRLPIVPKPIPQREFEKKVQSMGMYHKLKLPSISETTPPLIRQSVIKYPSQQSPNIRTWIPRSNYFDFLSSPTRHGENAQMPNVAFSVVAKQPHSSASNPSKIHCNPAQSIKSKKNIPNLISISIKSDDCALNKGAPPSLPANNSIANVKPILMLSRCERGDKRFLFKNVHPSLKIECCTGIRLEWTIPKVTQFDQIASYILHARKEKRLTPSAESPWLKVAVFTQFPLPMSYKFTEVVQNFKFKFSQLNDFWCTVNSRLSLLFSDWCHSSRECSKHSVQ